MLLANNYKNNINLIYYTLLCSFEQIEKLIFNLVLRTHEIKTNLIYLGLSKACEHDEECKDICEGFKGYCNTKEETCVCAGGKFAEKFSLGHHSKSDNN